MRIQPVNIGWNVYVKWEISVEFENFSCQSVTISQHLTLADDGRVRKSAECAVTQLAVEFFIYLSDVLPELAALLFILFRFAQRQEY